LGKELAPFIRKPEILGAAKILNYLMVILIAKVAQNWVWKINLMLLMCLFILRCNVTKKIPTLMDWDQVCNFVVLA
jgi:hypothetical protein